jgi:3-oxoacyl-[acyl-carrier-protein] synthase II
MMQDVLITGVGLVSCLGEGIETHLKALRNARQGTLTPLINTTRFQDYPVHALAPVSFDTQIPKKSDQRQMEGWQRMGVHAAGLALEHAGLKGNVESLSALHLIVAAGGGERDQNADSAILTDMVHAENPLEMLNERLMSDIRPTLFLAQLSNLLAGNISIVHGVTGASRTFMGEEQAGVDALRTAQARIASGQAEAILVGGSFNGERDDVIMQYALNNVLFKGQTPQPVFARKAPHDGFVFGSGGAFVLLESARHAAARHVRALAKLNSVVVGRAKRSASSGESSRDDLKTTLNALLKTMGSNKLDFFLSNATGIANITDIEREVLTSQSPRTPVIATGDLVGHTLEAQSLFSVALAALSVHAQDADRVGIISVGHQRGEGVMSVEKANA